MDRTGVIIVAGGSGTRMGTSEPKQFMPIAGREILVRTLEIFLTALPGAEIVIVLPADQISRWDNIISRYGLQGTHRRCKGGDNRFMSVSNGLAALGDCEYIAVHDGVRPLVSSGLIHRCLGKAINHGTAIPVIEPVDSFRIIRSGKAETIDRSLLRAVQTPQVFRADILRNAYTTGYDPSFTDDASVVEHSGIPLSFCQGEHSNIKITHPDDILIAGALLG